MTKKKHKESPLELLKELAFSKDGPVIVTHRKRGFLMDVHVAETNKEGAVQAGRERSFACAEWETAGVFG